MTLLYIILTIIVLLLLWAITIYNGLVRLKNQVLEAWSGIDVQLKRRYELIPNLVETVKGYQKHESDVFTTVAQLRTSAMQAQSVADKAQAESALSLGLGKLFAVAENYPELKASANFIDLQQNLSSLEDNIQNARRYYNGVTRDYNSKIQSFPDNIIANQFNFTARDFFQSDNEAAEKVAPKVSF